MNNFYKYLLLTSLIGLKTLHANSTCEKDYAGYSVETRAGIDVCYKYNKNTDTTHEMEVKPPDSSGNWKRAQDKRGNKDIWEKKKSK